MLRSQIPCKGFEEARVARNREDAHVGKIVETEWAALQTDSRSNEALKASMLRIWYHI